jgi:hypothetical protein
VLSMPVTFFSIVCIAGAAALFCVPGLVLGMWIVHCYRRGAAVEMALLAQSVEDCRKSCGEEIEKLSRSVLVPSVPVNEPAIQTGNLSRSGRAQALKLLRAGIAPETAAQKLGLPGREVRLLSKISRLLYLPESN